MQVNEIRLPGRPKGSLNKSTLEKIRNGEIEDPRTIVKKHYSHPGRPKGTKKKKVRIRKPKKLTEDERLEICKDLAFDWCARNNADLWRYNVDFFIFRYKNDPTYRRYQIGYEEDSEPTIWIPYTSYEQKIDM